MDFGLASTTAKESRRQNSTRYPSPRKLDRGSFSRRAFLQLSAASLGALACGASPGRADNGILSNALHPGAIATGLQKHTGGLKTPVERRKKPEQGAATSVLLAASPLLKGVGGLYFEDCNEAMRVEKRPTDFTGGYAAYAVDPENAERLWKRSHTLISEGV